MLHNRKQLKERRRGLRSSATMAESILWKLLQGRRLSGRKFRRQHSIGPYVVDFYCPSERLVIEVDGEVHDDPFRRAYDTERQEYLQRLGFNVLRFDNRYVLEQPDLVGEAIMTSLRENGMHC